MFHQYAPDTTDTPPELANLYMVKPSLGDLGFIPFLVGGASAAATLLAWSDTKRRWSEGEYNDYMRQMNDTIKEWDKLGWKAGCWQKAPAKQKAWKAFWSRFSKHYREWPTNPGRELFSQDVLSDAEYPARNLMRQLAEWGNWLNSTCQAGTSVPAPLPDPYTNGGGGGGGGGGGKIEQVGNVVMWGAIGIGAIVLLNVVQGVRGAFPRRRL
jgi:hypothetical protein